MRQTLKFSILLLILTTIFSCQPSPPLTSESVTLDPLPGKRITMRIFPVHEDTVRVSLHTYDTLILHTNGEIFTLALQDPAIFMRVVPPSASSSVFVFRDEPTWDVTTFVGYIP